MSDIVILGILAAAFVLLFGLIGLCELVGR
jgi:hypothetical protein